MSNRGFISRLVLYLVKFGIVPFRVDTHSFQPLKAHICIIEGGRIASSDRGSSEGRRPRNHHHEEHHRSGSLSFSFFTHRSTSPYAEQKNYSLYLFVESLCESQCLLLLPNAGDGEISGSRPERKEAFHSPDCEERDQQHLSALCSLLAACCLARHLLYLSNSISMYPIVIVVRASLCGNSLLLATPTPVYHTFFPSLARSPLNHYPSRIFISNLAFPLHHSTPPSI